MAQPNGIIGTPDGQTLYVADIRSRQTFAYDFTADGRWRTSVCSASSGRTA